MLSTEKQNVAQIIHKVTTEQRTTVDTRNQNTDS